MEAHPHHSGGVARVPDAVQREAVHR